VVPIMVDGLVSAVPWFASVIAAILAVFTIYIGVALAVTLFHPDPRTRHHAGEILRQLLQAVSVRWPR
jgi:hypothetical protein